MRLVNPEKLAQLQKKAANVRNICILAHVDHGKTTLADSLVASNGIISQRLAGKLRYMDSRKDEQERGITMKSSSISLFHMINDEEHLINLIDSPGHVDFSSEVSTALRLCDGALIVVDVVEGVCAQTIVAIRQAWQENIKPVVVLNKIDRLILEMKLAPLDAYVHMTQVLEKVNVVMAELLTSEVMGKESSEEEIRLKEEKQSADTKEYYDWNTGMDDVDDSNLYFSPDQGNVIFASAADGWGFRVEDFARIFAEKLGVRQEILNKTLWGDYYLNTKLKRIMKKAQEKAKKPLFVQLVLDNLWALYDAIAVRKDRMAMEKMVTNLGLDIPARTLKQNDLKQVLQSVMSAWLPLSKTVLDMVCQKLPSPLELSDAKVERLMFSRHKSFLALPPESQALKKFFIACDSSDDAPVIVFVSKMFAVERSVLPENRPRTLTAEEIAARRDQARQRLAEKLAQPKVEGKGDTHVPVPEVQETKEEEPEQVNTDAFIAFARVYSGTLKKNSKLYVLGPRYDPATAPELQNGEAEVATCLKDLKPGHHVTLAEIKSLYMLMGRELESLEEVPAGNILGIGGLEEHVLKTATISSTLLCPTFTDLNLIAVPILRVALEPAHPADVGKLVQGLKLLNQADPCVQIIIQDTGEHVLVTAGEVHLQRCLDDLRERFCKIEIHASKPIVPFRETIIDPPKLDMVNEAIESQQASKPPPSSATTKPGDDANGETSGSGGLITQMTANKKCTIKIRAAPLPPELTKFLDSSAELIRGLKDLETMSGKVQESISTEIISDLMDFKRKLESLFKEAGWDPETVNRIWSFGPKKCGPNVLINKVTNHVRGCVWPSQLLPSSPEGETIAEDKANQLNAYDSNFVNGFQLASLAGPLCEEPMMGIAFIVEDWSIDSGSDNTEGGMESENLPTSTTSQPFGPFSGQIMSAVRDACRKAFQAQPQRLMVAMYSCSIQVNAEVLGKLYAVLGKRGGRILHGDLQEGSTMFEVIALLPVVESFDFANEVRRQTSGLALPQLVFSGWEVLEIDPFWQPTTEEEYLHFGEKADTENRARKYMNAVRKRKGLRVEEKIVEFAEKQRTLTRNK